MAFCIPWNTNLLNIVIQNRQTAPATPVIIMLGRSSAGNTIAISSNLTTWTRNNLFTVAGRAVAYNGTSQYIAVGDGTNTMLTSTDNGTTWTSVTSPFTTSGSDIIYAGTQFVACGSGTNMLARYTGTSWTSITVDASNVNRLYYEPVVGRTYALCNGSTQIFHTTNVAGTWTKIGYYMYLGNYNGMHGPADYNTKNLWIANGSTGLSTSLDGSSWTTPTALTGLSASSIAYGSTNSGDPLWLMAGTGASDTLAYSSNGTNWTLLGNSRIRGEGRSVVFGADRTGNAICVATGTGANTIAYSNNGISWTGAGNTILRTSANCVAFGTGAGGRTAFVAGGYGGNTMALSVDGVAWVLRTNPLTTAVNGLAFGTDGSGNPMWVAVGSGSSNTITYSFDASTWVGAGNTILSTSGTCVEYGTGGAGLPLWVAGGTGTYSMAWSGTGILWTGISQSAITNPTKITYGTNGAGNPYWLATGTGGFAYSTDGKVWSALSPPIYTTSICVAQEKRPKYIICGRHFDATNPDSLRGSIDGLTLFYIKSPFSVAANDVCWSQDQQLWVAVGEGGNTVAYSSNGIKWTGLSTTVFSLRGNRVIYKSSSATWYAVGEGTNTLATSSNGQLWTPVTSVTGYVDISGMAIFVK